MDRFPDNDVTVIVLSNSYATVSQDPIAEAIAAIVFGQRPPLPPDMRAATIAQSALASCAGQYQYGQEYFVPNAKFTVTDQPGYLLLQLGNFRTPLAPLSANAFLERTFFGRVVISRDPRGNVDGLTYHYAGKDFSAQRMPAGKQGEAPR